MLASLLNKYKPPIKTNDDGDDNFARNMRLACASVENPVEKSLHSDIMDDPKLRKLLMLRIFRLTSLFSPLIILETSHLPA